MYSDMYSLGVTLFQMTFGRLPFSVTSSNVQEWLRAHQIAPMSSPSPGPPRFPRVGGTFWQNYWRSNRSSFATYDELLCDLNALRPMSLPTAGRLQRAWPGWSI